jgi:hypothetical protein
MRAAVVGNLIGMVQPDRLSIVYTLDWHSGHIGTQQLLRDIGNDSCEHPANPIAQRAIQGHRV